jgi:hypothetical protein
MDLQELLVVLQVFEYAVLYNRDFNKLQCIANINSHGWPAFKGFHVETLSLLFHPHHCLEESICGVQTSSFYSTLSRLK